MLRRKASWFIGFLSAGLLVFLAVQVHTGSAARAEPGVHIVRSDEQGLVLDVYAPFYAIEMQTPAAINYQQLTVTGFEATTEPGKPQLPQWTALLGVPAEARVEIHILSDESELLAGKFNLSPSPSPAPLTDDLRSGTTRVQPDARVYASDGLYPVRVAEVTEDAWLREQRVVRVVVSPFQYNPVTGELVWHRHLQIEVHFDRSSNSSIARLAPSDRPDPFEPVYRQSLLNYEVARAWRGRNSLENSNPVSRMSAAATPQYKIVVDHDGLYQITYAALQAAGVQVDTLDPNTFHMTSQGQDVAIDVAAQTPGHFSPGDAITFYGQKFYGDYLASQYYTESLFYYPYYPTGWIPHFNAAQLEKYTDDNVYWLTFGGTPGPRMATIDGTPDTSGTVPKPSVYTTTVHTEESHFWYLISFTSEDSWYWDRLQTSLPTTRTYTTTLSAVASVPFSATVRGDVVSRQLTTYHTRFSLNTMSTALEDTTWGNLAIPVRHHFETQVDQSNLLEGTNSLYFGDFPTSYNDVYFDWFEIQYLRRFQADGDQVLFSGTEVGPRQYAIGNFMTNTLTIYAVTNPFTPQHVLSSSITSASGLFTTTFQIGSMVPVTYFVAGADTIQSPKSISSYVPPDLYSTSNGADYLIITHHDFITASQTLADYRASQGWRVKVIDVDDLYNEFNFGIYHPIAIKNFLHYAYDNWNPAPAYVVLVGDGNWNFKNFNNSMPYPGSYGPPQPIYMPPNLSWVDPWQGEVDSANLLVAFTPPSHIPSMFIGRLLVDSPDQLNTIIGKIEAYEQAGPQPYQRNVLFAADNPDSAGDFVASSDGIISRDIPPNLTVNRAYLPNFYLSPYHCTPSLSCPAANYAITTTLNTTGALFLNYTGHGAQVRWAAESMLSITDIPTLSNTGQLPIVLSLTCLDGYWPYPNQPSFMQEMVRASNGGAVAAFSPTGLGLTDGHDTLADGFYTAVFSGGIQHLGPATLAAKINLFKGGASLDLIDTFTIFGDPALRLPTYAIGLSPVSASQVSVPGATAVYMLQVTNTAYLTDVLTLSTAGNTWPVTLSTTSLTLSSGGSAALAISVTVPAGTLMGIADQVTVTVASIGDSTRPTAQLTTTAGIVYGVNVTPMILSQIGQAGQTVTYTLRITNTGNISSTFALTAANYSWPTVISPLLSAPLLAGAGSDVNVWVAVPLSSRTGVTDTALVTVMAQGGSLPSATATLITTAQYRVFLPLILKH